MKPNYNAEKRRKELDRKKKKDEKDLKKKLRKEAIARGEIPADEAEEAADDDETTSEAADPAGTPSRPE